MTENTEMNAPASSLRVFQTSDPVRIHSKSQYQGKETPMKEKGIRSLRSAMVAAVLCGLVFLNLPSGVSGQKAGEGISQQPNVIIKEILVDENRQTGSFRATTSSLFAEARGGRRGPKKPPVAPALTQWEIAGQPGVKIMTDRDDWYHVSAASLSAAGFDTNSSSFNWQLFLDGVEIPMQVNPDGSIEFYGLGVDNNFTDSKVYYLIDGANPGLRLSESYGGTATRNAAPGNFRVRIERKDRLHYVSGLVNGETENWFATLVGPTEASVALDAVNLDSSATATLKVNIQGLTAVEHIINVKVNGNDVGSFSFSNKNYHQQELNVPVSYLNPRNNQVSFLAVASGSDYSLLDSVSLTFSRRYEAIDDRLRFSVPAGQTALVEGFSGPGIRVFEIQNGRAVNRTVISTETVNGSYGFGLAAAGSDRTFIAVGGQGGNAPDQIKPNVPSSLNLSSNRADFIIISHASVAAQAGDLAARRNAQGLSTMVALTEDIADEFGHGTITPQAIRDFLQHAASNWSRAPKFVLLFGDSSFDIRDYQGGAHRNLVPTKLVDTQFMETSSDGWLVDFDNDGVENLAIGRLPVGNAAEAALAVGKIVRYESFVQSGPKKALLAADYYFEILNQELEALLPSDFTKTKLDRGTMSDADMRQAIFDNASENPTFVSYLGHGTPTNWSNASLFGVSQAQTVTNQKLSFYMLMTCLNGFTHDMGNTSLTESLVLSPNGAIAVWSSSGSTYASGQIAMSQEVVRLLFPNGRKNYRLGDVVRLAKQTSGDMDARRTWQLMGDPTIIIE